MLQSEIITHSEQEADRILSWLCVEWGFCDARYKPIERYVGVTAESFARFVLEDEGMSEDRKWKRDISRKVQEFLVEERFL
ncbi:MAG: hypothetical protein AAFN80_12290 [Pseudomonadota bacterium]